MKAVSCLCTSLRRAAQLSSEIYDDFLAPSGLKVTMYRLLKQIRDSEFGTLTELAALVGLERSTLGRNIKVLERRGLVIRTEGADERGSSVDLTEAGLSALEEAEPLWSRAQEELHRRLGDGAEELLTVLRRLEG